MRGWMAALLALLAPITVEARTLQALGEGWKFRQDDALKGAEVPAFDDSRWEIVSVPHSWNRAGYYLTGQPPHLNTEGGTNLHQGVGWYRLKFKAKTADKAWLEFDAASRLAEVWLNGTKLGIHRGGFSRFRFDATSALKRDAENILVVRTDNSLPAPGNATADILPLAGDFFVHGGLYRGVRLIGTSSLHFDMLDHGGSGVYAATTEIGPESVRVHILARVANDGNDPVKSLAKFVLIDASGAIVASAAAPISIEPKKSQTVETTLTVKTPHLWQGVEDPYLYRLAATIGADEVAMNFGIRSMRVDPDQGFFLNGRRLALHGVSRHQDREGKGWAISGADEDEDVALIRELGANTIRLAHYQQSEHLHDLADRLGLVLWDEIPLVSKWTIAPGQMTPSDALIANARQQLVELIRQNFNHPAVAVWGIANEVDFGVPVSTDFGFGEGAAPDPTPLLKALNALAKSEDASRPSTLATCCEGYARRPPTTPPIVSELTDVNGANRYFGWYYDAPTVLGPHLDKLHAAHPAHAMSMSEYGAGGALSQQTDNPEGGPPADHGRIQPEGYQSYVHERSWADLDARPYLWATWIWNMFDFATTVRREGDSVDVNTKGLVTYDRRVRKDAFYFYRANWSKSPVVHVTGRRYRERAYAVVEVKIYSNAPATRLALNGRDMGTRENCPQAVCVWPNLRLDAGDNDIVATGRFGTQEVTDEIRWHLDPQAFNHVWIDCGSLMGIDGHGSDEFFAGGVADNVSPRIDRREQAVVRRIVGARNEEVAATFRRGNFAYDIPLGPGRHRVTLTFVEPDEDAAGKRLFDVVAGGKAMLKDLDVYASAGGALRALEKSFDVEVTGDRLRLDFIPKRGEALVSAIEIDPAK